MSISELCGNTIRPHRSWFQDGVAIEVKDRIEQRRTSFDVGLNQNHGGKVVLRIQAPDFPLNLERVLVRSCVPKIKHYPGHISANADVDRGPVVVHRARARPVIVCLHAYHSARRLRSLI